MFCNSCGAEVMYNAAVCHKCGAPLARRTAAPGNPVKVSNHMVLAVITTLFCCLFGGIIAIVYSSKVNTRLAQGDIAGALAASKTARNWIIVNIVVGCILPIVFTSLILLSALTPAVSSAMVKAQATAAAMNGRKLHSAIVTANINRESAGLPNVWPRTAGSPLLSGERGDISEMAFNTSADYFKVLFDKKYIDDVDKECLTLSKGGRRSCDWIVAANVGDEISDDVPVLISANVDPETLKTSYDGYDSSPIPFGSMVGRKGIPWGDAAVVVVRKSGDVSVFRKRQFTYDNLYNRRSFSAPRLKYLDVE